MSLSTPLDRLFPFRSEGGGVEEIGKVEFVAGGMAELVCFLFAFSAIFVRSQTRFLGAKTPSCQLGRRAAFGPLSSFSFFLASSSLLQVEMDFFFFHRT